MHSTHLAAQRALAVGRGRFRARAPFGAKRWDGWSSAAGFASMERFSASECRHVECGLPLREHAWIAPDVLVCPGDFLACNEYGVPAVVLKVGQVTAEEVEAARWSASPGLSTVDQIHGPCGRPLADHGWLRERLVCPGDWVLAGAQQNSALSLRDLFTLYEAVP